MWNDYRIIILFTQSDNLRRLPGGEGLLLSHPQPSLGYGATHHHASFRVQYDVPTRHQPDRLRQVATLGALQHVAAGHRMLGVARLISSPGSDTVEFAILIGDPWQGHGVGAELLRRLAVIAAHRGYKTLWGLVLRENRAMIELAHKLKWPVFFDADFSEVEIRLDLTTVKESEVLAETVVIK